MPKAHGSARGARLFFREARLLILLRSQLNVQTQLLFEFAVKPGAMREREQPSPQFPDGHNPSEVTPSQ